jgi:glutathione S-transferase
MASSRHVTFFHSPHSRAAGVRVLIEHLQAEHTLQVLDLRAGEQRQDPYLRVNPMGKVPALLHGDTLVTEQAAVYMYLAELYPEAGLAPAPGEAQRGAYLRWMVFYGSCYEPAIVDKALKREPGPASTSPYGHYDTVMETLRAQLAGGPWLLGERLSAADFLWGAALQWTMMFKIAPELPEFKAYVERYAALPAVQRAAQLDEALLKQAAG